MSVLCIYTYLTQHLKVVSFIIIIISVIHNYYHKTTIII